MMFVEAIVEKNFRQTISLTAARGRVIILKQFNSGFGVYNVILGFNYFRGNRWP